VGFGVHHVGRLLSWLEGKDLCAAIAMLRKQLSGSHNKTDVVRSTTVKPYNEVKAIVKPYNEGHNY